MEIIRIKPLSVNEAYRGRRFATKELSFFKQLVGYSIKKSEVPEGRLAVKYIFGVSSKGSDGDNLIKAFQDALCERLRFNDNRIYRWEVQKEIVKKGYEYIGYEIAREKIQKNYKGNQSVC